jgi:uncharacterized SAM-binding protein YcdF (DUF218 family)
MLLLALIYAVVTAVGIMRYGGADEKTPSNVAIVLGAGTTDGQVSSVYRERINHGIWLYENHYVDYLILTGGIGKGNTLSDAYAAKQYAISCGVPENVIFIEEVSTITEENLQQAKLIMERQGWKTAIVVSDPLHMKRAMLMASDFGITAVSSPTPTTMYRTWKTKLPFLARELFFYTGYGILRPFR